MRFVFTEDLGSSNQKLRAIAIGVSLAAAIPWTTHWICHQLLKRMPVILYEGPSKEIIDLAQRVNRGSFEYIMSGSLWAMYLGPIFVFCLLISLKKLSFEAVMRSLLATSFYCATILLIAFGQFFWTHAFGHSSLFSPSNMISHNGDIPIPASNYMLTTSVFSFYLLLASFFSGLLTTNSWLKKQPTISFQPHSKPSSSNAQKLMEKEKPVKLLNELLDYSTDDRTFVTPTPESSSRTAESPGKEAPRRAG